MKKRITYEPEFYIFFFFMVSCAVDKNINAIHMQSHDSPPIPKNKNTQKRRSG